MSWKWAAGDIPPIKESRALSVYHLKCIFFFHGPQQMAKERKKLILVYASVTIGILPVKSGVWCFLNNGLCFQQHGGANKIIRKASVPSGPWYAL